MRGLSNLIEGIDYGPLALLAGEWQGHDGMDIAPEADGSEQNPFYESIVFEAIGDVTNAERQTLAALRYQQVVRRKSNDEVFHNETGYWIWDAEQSLVMQTLTIPRGVSLVAGGPYRIGQDGTPTVLEVRSAIGDPDWTISQSPFMRDHAKTVEFTHTVSVGQAILTYSETTLVDIYGKQFEHTDENSLIRS